MSWPWPFLCPQFCKFTKSKQIWVEVLFDSDSQRCTGSWAAFLSASPPCWLSPVALPTSFKPGYLSCPRAASAGRAPAPPARHVIPVESCVCGELIFSSTLFGIRTQPDRKSTRLNSSHLVISYAVFCLKKKKKKLRYNKADCQRTARAASWFDTVH